MMDSAHIVLTGAPASGKTVFFERLKKHPDFTGFLFFEELARQLLEEYPAYRHNRNDFHREIYRRQIERETKAGNKPFITDRGTADAFAFHPETAEMVGTTIPKEYKRYTAVIQLGSAASLGEQWYQKDHIRMESIDEALAIEKAIAGVWREHPGYHFIDSERDFEKKYEKFLALMHTLIREYNNKV